MVDKSATGRFDRGKTETPKAGAKTQVKKADSIDKKEPPAKAPKRTAQTDVAPKRQPNAKTR